MKKLTVLVSLLLLTGAAVPEHPAVGALTARDLQAASHEGKDLWHQTDRDCGISLQAAWNQVRFVAQTGGEHATVFFDGTVSNGPHSRCMDTAEKSFKQNGLLVYQSDKEAKVMYVTWDEEAIRVDNVLNKYVK